MIERYNYNDEPSGRTDTLVQALDKIERLEKQLKIAVEALETIEKKSDKFDDSWSIQEQLDYIKAEAQSRLYQINQLNNN